MSQSFTATIVTDWKAGSPILYSTRGLCSHPKRKRNRFDDYPRQHSVRRRKETYRTQLEAGDGGTKKTVRSVDA